MNDLEFYNEHNFKNTKITRLDVFPWDESGIRTYTINIEGDFNNGDYKHYDLTFGRSKLVKSKDADGPSEAVLTEFQSIKDPVLVSVSIIQFFKEYRVKIEIKNEERSMKISFQCETFWACGHYYRGLDYTNVYGTEAYSKWVKDRSYVFAEKYFVSEDETELPDGYSFYERNFDHSSGNSSLAYGSKCELRKNGKCIYEYISNDLHHSAYKDFIYHSNGHRYYPFHIDLYGISFIDVDTLEVFNYVPRGYDNDYGIPAGESFIVVSANYDRGSDLIAYEGCYWAGPYDVMVGKFDSPLNFDPHLISVSDYFDSKHEELPELDFVAWSEEGLTVKYETDDGTETRTVSFDVLKSEMLKQNKERKQG